MGSWGRPPNYYLPSSRDEDERQYAVRHTLRTIDCAAALGAKAVVMHLGLGADAPLHDALVGLARGRTVRQPQVPATDRKSLTVRDKKRQKHLDQVYRTLEAILPRAREVGVKLGMETRLGIEEIPSEEEADQILTRFGTDAILYWHDVGHAAIKEALGLMNQEAILNRFRGRTAGMHLQDFTPPAEDHQPPGLARLILSDWRRL